MNKIQLFGLMWTCITLLIFFIYCCYSLIHKKDEKIPVNQIIVKPKQGFNTIPPEWRSL